MNGHDQPGRAPIPIDTFAVEPPKHPMGSLTTYELRDYRRQLERAIAYFDKLAPVPPARDRLRVALDEVITEQDARKKLARA